MAAKKMKSSERTTLIGKLTTALKKRYGSKPPEPAGDRGVLETLIYSALVENTIDEAAEAAYVQLHEGFHDLNEVRVSSIREIERTIDLLPEADWRSLRLKDALQHVFELNFTYDLDGLRKKNQEQASSDLAEIPNISPFMHLYTQQVGLKAHVVPVDRHTLALLRWLGLTELSVDEKQKPEEVAADEIKSAVRKADGPLLTYLLRQAANEPSVLEATLDYVAEDQEIDADAIDPKKRISELDKLIDGAAPKASKKVSKPAKKAVKASSKATKKTAKKAAK